MGKLHLQGGDFRVCLCRFFSARQRFVACQFLYHLLINNRFQFRSNDFPAPRTTLVIQPFRTAKVLLAGGIEDTHKGIPAVSALDFSRQPCMGGFPGRLDFHVVHQLLAASQPDVGGNNALMGSQHQHLAFQVVLFAGLHIPPLIQIAAIHAGKIGSVIDNDCPLTFEKFVHIKVCLHIDRIA